MPWLQWAACMVGVGIGSYLGLRFAMRAIDKGMSK